MASQMSLFHSRGKDPPGFEVEAAPTTEKTAKPNAKFVPLYDARGKQAVVLIPGRHGCDCQATRHSLIRNCISCGRIVCEQERSGPCLFCGNFVAARDEMEAMKKASAKGKRIYEFIMKTHNEYLLSKGLQVVSTELPDGGPLKTGGLRTGADSERDTLTSITSSIANVSLNHEESQDSKDDAEARAVEFKDRLINYDRNSSKRTQVIDDESDYFGGADSWQTPEQRAQNRAREQRLREQKKRDEKNRNITIDVLGRSVVESVNNLSIYQRAQIEDEAAAAAKIKSDAQQIELMSSRDDATLFPMLANHTASLQIPTFVSTFPGEELKQSYLSAVKDNLSKGLKLQDSFLQEMTDQGVKYFFHC